MPNNKIPLTSDDIVLGIAGTLLFLLIIATIPIFMLSLVIAIGYMEDVIKLFNYIKKFWKKFYTRYFVTEII